MSLFKLDSKIYGAWSISKEEDLLRTSNFSDHPGNKKIKKPNRDNNNANNKPKHYIKKFLNLKFF